MLGLFFAKASALTFGSGLAVVPFLHHTHLPVRRRPGAAVPPLRATPAPAGLRQGRNGRRCRRDRRRRDRDRPPDDPRLALGRDRRRRTRPATAETDQGARAGTRRRGSDRWTRTPLRG